MKVDRENQNESEHNRLDFPEAPQTGFAGVAAAIGARNLLIIIFTMPVVFLVVVVAIISVIGGPDEAPAAAAPEAASRPAAVEEPAGADRRAVLPVPASAPRVAPVIVLPAGADIGAMALDGDRLALRVATAEGEMIVIYDLAEDAVVKTIPLTEEE